MIDAQTDTLITLFDRCVARAPDSIALTDGQARISYRELQRSARRLSARLVQQGISRGDVVALCLPRGATQVTAVLAVLRLGAAYLPMERVPDDRTRELLERSSARAVVTEHAQLERFGALAPALARLDVAAADADAGLPEVLDGATPQLPAYVIYTSGSTGLPKGVLVTHQQVVSLFASGDQLYRFGAQDVWTLFHSYAFDFSVWELWGALAFGGRLVIVPELCTKSAAEFAALLTREQVTVVNQTPSAFYRLVDEPHPNDGALRLLIFGGEALDRSRVRRWLARPGLERVRAVNMYGITETTVFTSYQDVQRESDENARSDIGVPMPSMTTSLLSEHGTPVDPGELGELHVGGCGVSLGYLGQPELTAERFVPDPDGAPGSRMYRSGDLAKWHDDGGLEFIGRADTQIKLRGYRIELREIEVAAVSHADVADAVVLCHRDRHEELSLVGFLVPARDRVVDLTAVKEHLRDRLPAYMVPTRFVSVDLLPLNQNGKLDREELLRQLANEAAVEEDEESLDPLEAFVIGVWKSALDVPRIRVDDDFFAIGGQSLKAVRIARELGISVVDLFQNPTPRATARVVMEHIRAKGGSAV